MRKLGKIKKRATLPRQAPKRTGKRGPRPEAKDQLLTEAAHQARLPGMEDAAISAIETAAYEYNDAKERRMNLLKKEIELKHKLRQAMQKHTTKSTYRHDDVLVILTPPKEGGVKVVIGDEGKLDAVQKASQSEEEKALADEQTSIAETQASEEAEESLGNA